MFMVTKQSPPTNPPDKLFTGVTDFPDQYGLNPNARNPPFSNRSRSAQSVATAPDMDTNPDSTSHRSKLSGHICVWSNCQACDSEGENPGNAHFRYWMLTRTFFTFSSSGQTWRCYCRLRCEKNQLRPILLRPTHSTSHRLQAGY